MFSSIQKHFLRCKMLVGECPKPLCSAFSNAGYASLRDAFYPVMLSGSLRTCMRCDAASAREAYFICSGTGASRSKTPHSCIQSASSFCASSAASRRISGGSVSVQNVGSIKSAVAIFRQLHHGVVFLPVVAVPDSAADVRHVMMQFFFAAPLRSFGQNALQFRKSLLFFVR